MPGIASLPRVIITFNGEYMDEELKKKVIEIGETVKALPPNVQEKAFEMLLARELGLGGTAHRDTATGGQQGAGEAAQAGAEQAIQTKGGEDLGTNDLHLKARKFLEKQSLSLDDLNELFYKQGDDIEPLFEDLKTTKSSESQIRLGLLSALRNAIKTGEFEFSGEDVRQQCQLRKTYDSTNFKANFRNNRRLFDKFDSYEKEKPTIRLSEEGRSELAKLIKELQ
ncbi:MAG: hypothetical protein JWN74_847 [Acidobacteriaceae bacterium]|nr:hypothetical protein [Acidobacteriaceae bacterium]